MRKDFIMKKTMLTVMLMSCFLIFQIAPYVHAAGSTDKSETQILVDMLVESGVLTRQQGDTFAKRAKALATKKAKRKDVKHEESYRTAREDYVGNDVQVKWDNRLEFGTRDGNFKGAIGGRIQADAVYIKGESDLETFLRPQSDFNTRNDRAFIRRARIYFRGTIYEDFFYKLQYDFAGDVNEIYDTTGDADFMEEQGFRGAYMGMKNIPYIGKVTVGQFKEPFSLEELTSSNDITFLERGLPTIFAPGYSWGAAINNNWFDERVTLGVGAFRNSTESGTMVSSNEWNLTARATGLPWYDGEDRLLHVGTSYSLRVPDDRLDYDTGPELRTRDNFVNTTNFNADLENRLGFESAFVWGPLSLQGEFIQTWVDKAYDGNADPDTAYFYGAYAYISYFLTGEHRIFDKDSAEFKNVEPRENFSIKDGTWGAWEVAARYSYLDLDEKDVSINGGILNDVTLGVNWYLNPNMKLMFNYVHTHRNGVGYADGIQTRCQIEF
ncbi:MAG: hypothetical protein GF409_07425 [Candidatus Omnitrophica bacterium]|nr:hypothetical protein [Candidatus Omnitrophota bacterium]